MSQYVNLGRDELFRLLGRSIQFADYIQTRGGQLRAAEQESLARVEFSVESAPELGTYAIRRDDAERLFSLSSKLSTFSLRATLLDLPHAYLLFSWMAFAPILLERPSALFSVLLAPFWAWFVLLCVVLAPLSDFGMGMWVWCLTAIGFAISVSIIQARRVGCFYIWHVVAACVWLYFGYSTGVGGWLESFAGGIDLPAPTD